MLRLDDKTTGESFPVNITKFPDGTSQVWKTHIPPIDNTVDIYWQFEDEAELFHLLQLKSLLRNHSFISLYVPFLPYGRQDKDIDVNNTFAFHCFAEYIISMHFFLVITYDVHSNVAKKLFDYGLRNEMPLFKCGNVTYILPDHGATRYLDCLPKGAEVIVCDKVRDQSTGYITSYKINGDVEGKDVVVTDDIGDGMMTFNILGKNLQEMKPKSCKLYVSHGIFSKGLDEVSKYYDLIYTVNLINKSQEVINHPKLRIITDTNNIYL